MVITCRDEWSLGTPEDQPADFGSFDIGDRIGGRVLKVELECLAQVRESIVLAFAEARYADVKTSPVEGQALPPPKGL